MNLLRIFLVFSGVLIVLITTIAPRHKVAPSSNTPTTDISQIKPVVVAPSDSQADQENHLNESTQAVQRTVETWPITVIQHLKAEHINRDKAIDHIVRATQFEDFAALSIESTERLIRYTQNVLSQPAEKIPHLCWGHDTSDAYRRSFEGVRFLALADSGDTNIPQPLLQGDDRWSFTATDGFTGSSGTPVTITWSFVPDGTRVPDGGSRANNRPTTGPSDLIAELNAAYGAPTITGDLTTAPWFEMFETSFNFWEATTGNIYIYEPNDDGTAMLDFPNGVIGTRGDVRIGGTQIDGNGGTLAFNYFPDAGDMVIDSADSTNLGAGQQATLRNVITHEHGHGLGLSHVCPVNQTKLMEPFLSTAFVGPQFDDILTIQELYGDPLERQASNKNNNTALTARNLGVLNTTFNANELSIASANDSDIFRFQLTQGKALTLTVTPTNTPAYLEGSQNSDGSCSSGTLLDPQTRQDLILRVLDTDGTTVLASSNVAPIGDAESILSLALRDTGQNYYIEVTGGGENSGSANNAQAYSLEIAFEELNSVQIKNFTITAEACSPANGAADPDELITVQVTVENNATDLVENSNITLSGSANLNIIGSATQDLPDLLANSSTTVTYQFSLSGACGDTETISFQVNTDSGNAQSTHPLTLGIEETFYTEDFNATALNTIPSGYNESSTLADAKWRTVNTTSPTGSNAVFAPGKTDSDSVNSAYLESPTINSTIAPTQLLFDHSYNTEENYDGGVLEISIDNGSNWQEWTAAGGTYTQQGYSETIAPDSGNPLAGQSAWTGDSGGVVTTIAQFPPNTEGQDVQLRWHMSNDQSVQSVGWFIDNIRILRPACCVITIPTISLTAIDSIASEQDPADAAQFVITADSTPTSSLSISYTLAGTATSGSDFVALAGSATINAGESIATIPVTAITDANVEGDETLTLTLSPSVNYGINIASADITIKDLLFDAFRFENFGTASLNIADDADFDFDGVPNLIEYAFGLDPTNQDTPPFSLSVQPSNGTSLVLSYEEDTTLNDIEYIVETSPSLSPASWSSVGVTINSGTITDGLEAKTASVEISDQARFIRIRINRTAP